MIRLLLVDDQILLLEAISALLSLEADFEVVAAVPGAKEAIGVLKEKQVDIVVTDIEMEEMDGLALAEFVDNEYEDVKVMILTTFSKARYIQRSQQAKVHAYLLKDGSPEDLSQAIRRVHQGEVIIAQELMSQIWRANITTLTETECSILQLSLQGMSTNDIAEKIHLSHGTVRNYAQVACQKLNAKNRIEACAIAQRLGWI